MAANYSVLVGTAGQSVWQSQNGGETFARTSDGLFMEAEVRALTGHPAQPQTLYAGTDVGLYRSDDGGHHWLRLPGPFDPAEGWRSGTILWSVLVHPQEPATIFVGACPPAIYRSTDSGASWERLPIPLTPECAPISFSRVTCLVADPDDAQTIWAGVEIDGLWRSRDNGDHWERVSEGMSSQDIHALAIVPGTPRRLLAATNNDLNVSVDEGTTWQPQNVREQFPHGYCRGLLLKQGEPQTVFLGNGNGPSGSTGTLQISQDGGRSWTAAPLPYPPNSTVWTFAAHPSAPGLLFAATVSGYLYRSEDGGKSWAKCAHEFGEIRSLVVLELPCP